MAKKSKGKGKPKTYGGATDFPFGANAPKSKWSKPKGGGS